MPASVATVGQGRYRYYLDTVAAGWEDHRAPGLEPDGTWEGSGSPALGLSATVTHRDLAAVMSGASPVTGEVLKRRAVARPVAGFDATFSAPKAVSLLFALGDGAVATDVLDGHTAAVRAALAYTERSVVHARRGSGDRRSLVPVEGVVAAGFVHRTSRAADPHLHTHVLVANLARGTDGRWSAIDARALFTEAPVLSALYSAHLRQELVRRLGVVWERRTDGRIAIDGIGAEVTWAFSRRRQQVESWLEERGRRGARAARTAALSTRAAKDPLTSFDALRPWWSARARALGLGTKELASVIGRGPRELVPPSDLEATARQVVTIGFSRGSPGLTRSDVLEGWGEALVPGAPVATVEALTDSVLSSRLVGEVGATKGFAREGVRALAREGAGPVATLADSTPRPASTLTELGRERDALADQLSSSMPPDPGWELRETSAARARALRGHRPSEVASLEPRLVELERQMERRTAWSVERAAELSRLSALRRIVSEREIEALRGPDAGRGPGFSRETEPLALE